MEGCEQPHPNPHSARPVMATSLRSSLSAAQENERPILPHRSRRMKPGRQKYVGRDIGPCPKSAFAVIWIRPGWEETVSIRCRRSNAPETLRPKDQQVPGRTRERSVRARRRITISGKGTEGARICRAHDAGIVSGAKTRQTWSRTWKTFPLETHAVHALHSFARCAHGAFAGYGHAGPIPGRRIEGAPCIPRRRRPFRRVHMGQDRRAAKSGKVEDAALALESSCRGCARPPGGPATLRPLHQCRSGISTT